MICAESTWNACKQPEVVIPVEWSDNQIKVQMRLGGLKDQANFYFLCGEWFGRGEPKGFCLMPIMPNAANGALIITQYAPCIFYDLKTVGAAHVLDQFVFFSKSQNC